MMEIEKPGTGVELSLCTLRTGEDFFGIETSAVREALCQCEVREVPLAPKFVAGVLAYRGDILLAVSFHAVLGLTPDPSSCSAIVLQDSETGEAFALLIDELLDVVRADNAAWEPNPATLDERRSRLFSGVYRTSEKPLIRLDAQHIQPSWLMRNFNAVLQTGEQA
jgi:purine-binding chemotaxis protein CheW